MPRALRALLLSLVALCASAAPTADAQQPAPSIPASAFSQLHWRTIGPEGNRFTSAAGHPRRSAHLLRRRRLRRHLEDGRRRRELEVDLRRSAGAVDRCTRGVTLGSERGLGRHRRSAHPQPHLARPGDLQSVDAGRTWTLMGLEKTGPHRARRDAPDRTRMSSMACALGHAYGPQPERGVFRTTDGGATWTKVLFVDENTGMLGSADGSEESARALRRHVADRDSHLGSHQRWAGWRPLHLA